MDALDSVNELETSLDQSKESMYKLSYVIRVQDAWNVKSAGRLRLVLLAV